MKYPQTIAFLVISLSIGLAGRTSADPVEYFTNKGFDKPVSTMQHPNAEYYNGVTYIAYQGPHEDPYVCAYDHTKATWSGPFKAGISPLGKTPDPTDHGPVDNHGRPSLLVDGQGYIHIIFGGHGGDRKLGENHHGTPGRGKQIHVVSKNPEDISSWEILDNVSPFGTYPQFVKMPDGDIYLFYRHGSHRSDWVYQKSTDDCRTFQPPVSILKHKPQAADPNIHDSWYVWFHQGKGDAIAATYNHHPCARRDHSSLRVNVYYMTLNCGTDTWENVKGDALTLPISKAYADANTRVIQSEESIRRVTLRVDAKGHPHLFHREKGHLVYYRWHEDAWQRWVVFTPKYRVTDADFRIESPDVIRLLVTVKTKGLNEVCWWKTENGGQSWDKENSLISNDTNITYLMGSLVRNAHPDAQAVVSEVNPNQENLYRKLFLFGQNGPVRRVEE
jgi:hypothetical protein